MGLYDDTEQLEQLIVNSLALLPLGDRITLLGTMLSKSLLEHPNKNDATIMALKMIRPVLDVDTQAGLIAKLTDLAKKGIIREVSTNPNP